MPPQQSQRQAQSGAYGATTQPSIPVIALRAITQMDWVPGLWRSTPKEEEEEDDDDDTQMG
jgi:hypothetical protein